MEISAESFTKSAKADHGIENVLASYVRRRSMSIKDIQNEWGLTDGEARGVMYASASRATIRKVLKHPRGGWSVGLMLLTGVIGHDLSEHIEQRRIHEREQYKTMERRLREMAADLTAVRAVDSVGRSERTRSADRHPGV